MWGFQKDTLERYREAVADDKQGSELEAIVAQVEAAGDYSIEGRAIQACAPRLRRRPSPRRVAQVQRFTCLIASDRHPTCDYAEICRRLLRALQGHGAAPAVAGAGRPRRVSNFVIDVLSTLSRRLPAILWPGIATGRQA